MNHIGRRMACGWLGFLDAVKPLLVTIYGGVQNADDIISQVRRDYGNPNYHGYTLMYHPRRGVDELVIVLQEGSLLQECNKKM